MRLLFILTTLSFLNVMPVLAADSILLNSLTGDTLMIHKLKNGELWASFMLTDEVVDSFADHELIVLQIDNNQPINLEGKRSCGGAAGKKQTFSYDFLSSDSKAGNWQFSQSTVATTDVLQLLGQTQQTYQILLSDRRPEVVDFPIRASVGLASLLLQFQQGETLSFRYTTEANEQRIAKFDLDKTASRLTELLEYNR